MKYRIVWVIYKFETIFLSSKHENKDFILPIIDIKDIMG